MDKAEAIRRLNEEFPGKKIVDLPLGVICEVEAAGDNSWSRAVAYIKRSEPHYHEHTTEWYSVEEGLLGLVVDNEEYALEEGEDAVISPPSVHYAYGDWVRVRVYTEPAWSAGDHFLVE